MFGTLKTLFIGASARAEDRVRDVYALELIDQKIREVETGLKAAKATLASLIQRQRSEAKMVETLEKRAASMLERAQQAMDADESELATQAAEAVAQMENELELRRVTLSRLTEKTIRLQASVEAGHRRLVDLKQGAISARAVRREQDVQMRLVRGSGTSSIEEANELINRVLNKDDPFEKAQILQEIDQTLNHEGLETRMADAGFGPATQVTKSQVLARLKRREASDL